ncbi:DUF58 domain-containing protein [Cytophagaceae bacterium ABcell3]|nr:DUF58 domain-containing protein [Cytophagaceae bacterium ABcell3]
MKISFSEIKKTGNIELLARQMVEGFITGLHKSPYHGFSVEFAEHRLYNTGESTRHIDWKVYGRTDRLYTKRYEEETNLRCMLLIDTSSSMYYPEKDAGKLTFSIMAAACLSYILQRQRDAVGITTFSNEIELQTAIKSKPGHVHSLFLQLENLLSSKPKGKTSSVAQNLHHIADKLSRRSLVIIFSDMFDNSENQDELFSALQHLKHNKHEVLLFHVKDSETEERFNFDDRPYEFTDIETGEKLKVQPSQVREHYQKAIKAYYEELKLKCGQYKIDFIPADIREGFDQVLLSYLIKRQKMKA